jgi:preprotein translocase subunit SecD
MSGSGGTADADQGPAGATQLLFEADVREVARQRGEQMEDVLRGELRRNGVPFSQMQASNGEVRFLVDSPVQLRQAETIARNQIGAQTDSGRPAWTVQAAGDRQIVVRQTGTGVNDGIRQAMEVSREVIARRIEALGMLTPTVLLQGANRILIRVPATQDSEAVKSLIVRTGRLEFKLVEVDSVPCIAPRRPGIQFLPSDELPAGTCLGVQSRAMISGEQIADANQTHDDQNRVAVQVRFNVQGSQRFAQVTQANVGRRFAIILDNRVISAPMINEPILGGVAEIAGGFTVENANALAISLRSGRLPVEFHLVDERSIGANIRPDGATAANN